MTFVETLAIVLLSLGLVKHIIGFISPKSLKRMANEKMSMFPLLILLALLFVYAAFRSTMSLADWIIGAYGGIIVFMIIVYKLLNMKQMMKAFTKMPDSEVRKMSGSLIILLLIGLYFLLF
tara:strand:+ start:166 stop:528 length:363 start_codon:yes stop_codon:yes gene_type:complete